MYFKRVLLFLVLSCFLLVEVHLKRRTYYGYKLLRLSPNKTRVMMVLDKYGSSPHVSIWRPSTGKGDPLDVMVSPNFISSFNSFLKNFKIPYTVITENVGGRMDMEKIELRIGRPVEGLAFDRYMRYNEIARYLKEVAKNYTDLVNLSVIGKSYEGRDMFLLKINSKPKRQPVILIDAGIHAREWIAVSNALYIINQLTEHQKQNAHMLNGLEWHIIPLMNPDGYEFSHTQDRLWRKTRSFNKGSGCIGVDGNRNYDSHWKGIGASSIPCSETYAGSSAFSESEVRALRDHALSMNGSVKMYLTFHSYGNMILYPWGYKTAVPNNGKELFELGLKASNVSVQNGGPSYTVGGSALMLYTAAGGSDDWMVEQAKVPMAYTIELTDHPDGFILPPSEIQHCVEIFFKVLDVFAQDTIDKWKNKM